MLLILQQGNPLAIFWKLFPIVISVIALLMSIWKYGLERQNWHATCEAEIFQLKIQALFLLQDLAPLTEVNLDKKFFKVFYPFQNLIVQKRIFLYRKKYRAYFDQIIKLAKNHYSHFQTVPEGGCSVSPFYSDISKMRNELKKEFQLDLSNSELRNSYFESEFRNTYNHSPIDRKGI